MKIHAQLLYALAVGLFCLAVSGCETPYQRERILQSVRVEFGATDGELDRGKRDWGMDSSYAAVSFAPFAGLGGPERVVVVEATHAAQPCEGKPK